ncbi:MAG: hypothetical protein JW703_00995 [Candidatus Diapherotrites archaeon]|nr:hypothetical protein [Candidatus Diapherotrites archaeon]
MEDRIHLIVINQEYKNTTGILEEIKKRLNKFEGKHVIFLFPEEVLGKTARERTEIKEFVGELHKILKSHGKAYAAFSVLEKGKIVGMKPFILNTGYFVFPTKNKKYEVYPKITTIFKGRDQTEYDGENAEFNGVKEKYNASTIHRMSKKIRRFPEAVINDINTQLRVCADLLEGSSSKVVDPHKIREKPAEMIIVPARGLLRGLARFPEELNYMNKIIHPKGMAIISDKEARGDVLISKTSPKRIGTRRIHILPKGKKLIMDIHK